MSDVLVGDVWLCSGQSNMDMGLGGCGQRIGDVFPYKAALTDDERKELESCIAHKVSTL